MTKLVRDIEWLLQWAVRDELPKSVNADVGSDGLCRVPGIRSISALESMRRIVTVIHSR